MATLTAAQRLALSPQAGRLVRHMARTGSISAREAMLDLDMTSATLARRVCDLEEVGIAVERERRIHPVSGRHYTRYSLVG